MIIRESSESLSVKGREERDILEDMDRILSSSSSSSSYPRERWDKKILSALMPFLLLSLLWQLIASLVYYTRGVIFPTPLATAARFIELSMGQTLLQHSIYGHIQESLIRWGAGFFLALVIGMGVGIFMGYSSFIERLFMPLIYVLQPIPSLAWIPVAILLLGLGQPSTIFIIFLAGFFPIVINMTAGVESVSTMYIRAARMLGTNDRTLFFQVLLPAALPHLLSGFRVGLANGWRALIAAEMVAGAGSGLGYAIYQSRWNLDYTSAFVSIIFIGLIGLFIERFGFSMIEKRTVERWGMKRREV